MTKSIKDAYISAMAQDDAKRWHNFGTTIFKSLLTQPSFHGLQRPLCTVCKRLVDKVVIKRDERTRSTIITAYCHGDSQSVILTDRFVFDNPDLEYTMAFEEE